MQSPLKALPKDLSTLLTPGKVFVFTKTNCPFCDLAKEYFHEMRLPYEYIVCDTLGITDDHKEQLFQLTGAKSYPRIFVGKHSIGGFDDLRKADDNGNLEKLLKAEGITFKDEWWFDGVSTNHQEGFGTQSKISKLPERLDTLLAPGKVFIFTKTNCPFCDLAKEYLQEKEIAYEYVVCDTLGITDQQKEQLYELTGAKSYPRIFIGKNSIGGFDDLRSKDDKGEFERALTEAGVSYKKDWYTSSA